MRLLPTGLTYFLEVARTGSVSEVSSLAIWRLIADGATVSATAASDTEPVRATSRK